MSERTEAAKVKRSQISQAALKLFFERGYDGTSIRMIASSAGFDVGLFYYYFKSKDDVFNAALENFFCDYISRSRELVDSGRKNPHRELTKFIAHTEREVFRFRESNSDSLHWTVLNSLRLYVMQLLRSFTYEILEDYVKRGIIRQPAAGLDVISNMIAYSVGGSMLYQDKEEYEKQRPDISKLLSQLLGVPGSNLI